MLDGLGGIAAASITPTQCPERWQLSRLLSPVPSGHPKEAHTLHALGAFGKTSQNVPVKTSQNVPDLRDDF